MSQLNASRAVHVVLDIKVVVSRLVRGLILRHRAGRLVHSCAGLFQAVSPRLSTGSPWTGRIAAGGPAKEGLHGDCGGPAYQPGDIIGDPGPAAPSEHDEGTHHVRHSPVAGGAVSSQGEQENDGAGQPPSSVSSPSDQRKTGHADSGPGVPHERAKAAVAKAGRVPPAALMG